MSDSRKKMSILKDHTSYQVDAAVLQYQNQKLVQQLDVQKHELQDLEAKIKELKDKQVSYDTRLITLNQIWNQVFSPACPFDVLYPSLICNLLLSFF